MCSFVCVFLCSDFVCWQTNTLIFSRLELLSVGRINTVHVDTQGSEISANFDIGHFCFVLYGKFYTSAFEGNANLLVLQE